MINLTIQIPSVISSLFYYSILTKNEQNTNKINYCWSLWELPGSIIDNKLENNTFESNI